MYGRARAIHFIGIGGSGMSGLAEVLLTTGYRVSGSDLKTSEVTDRLVAMGGRVFKGHNERNVLGVDIVVYSSAVQGDNPELRAAIARGVPVIPRADMLAELMRMKYGIAIAGAHGKTTTTSMVGQVLLEGGLDPTIVVGGRVHALKTNARLGHGRFLVAEADESDGSFVRLTPAIGVITNLDQEHMDHYGTMAGLEAAFLEFAERTPFYGLVVCACTTLRGAFAQTRRYEGLAHDLGRSRLDERNGIATYYWDSPWLASCSPAEARHLVDSVLAGILTFVSWLAHERLPVHEFGLPYPEPEPAIRAAHAQVFGPSV